MKPTELACYLLIASAFVLGGFLLVTANQRLQLESVAQAEMVVDKGDFTILSTSGNSNGEIMYVLNNRSSILVCYEINPNKRLEVVGTLDVGKALQKVKQQTGSDRDSGNRSTR